MNITGEAKLAGVIGWPIAHSLSPLLHNYWLQRLEVDGAYVPLAVKPDALEESLRALITLGFQGANITLPHKEETIKFMDTLDTAAEAIGAVNTVHVTENGKLEGFNTDARGFIANLKSHVKNLDDYLNHCLVIGAGGAARAIIYALKQEGAKKITIVNRTPEKAEELADCFNGHCIPWEEAEKAMEAASLMVNTTSLGMRSKPPLPLSLDALPKNALVTDIVYTPLLTPLLRKANDRGNVIVDGIGMLIHQAVPAFELWYGRTPPVDELTRTRLTACL